VSTHTKDPSGRPVTIWFQCAALAKVDAAARADGITRSAFVKQVVLREAERLEAAKRREAKQPGVGEALQTVRTHLSTIMGEGK